MKGKYTVPAAVMAAYAAIMILAGVIAFRSAPEGANAATALIIPGVAGVIMLICALMTSLAARNQRVGRIGAHAGVMLTLLFTLLFGYTAWKRAGALERYPAAAAEYRQALEAGTVAATPEAQRAFFGERGASRHDITYLVRTLRVLTVASGAAFVVLLVLRPKPRPEAGASAT